MKPILTGRLLLRPLRSKDAEAALPIFGDRAVMQLIGSGEPITDLIEIRRRLDRQAAHQREHGFSMWAVIERSSGRLIGDAGLQHLDGNPEIEVGYRFAKSAWGKGYATEAAIAALNFGFALCQLDEILAVAQPGNAASVRVMQKIGLEDRGVAKYYAKDLVVYGATRRTWLDAYGS